MSAATTLDGLRWAGVVLRADGDRLSFRAPEGALTPSLVADVQRHRAEILNLVKAEYWPASEARPCLVDLMHRHCAAGFIASLKAVTGCDFEQRNPTFEEICVFNAHLDRGEATTGTRQSDRAAAAVDSTTTAIQEDSDMSNLRERLENSANDPANDWRPVPGDILVGTLIEIRTVPTPNGPKQLAVIRDDQGGKLWHVWLTTTVLSAKFTELAPRPGDQVGIRRDANHETKGYHRYHVQVERGGSAAVPQATPK